MLVLGVGIVLSTGQIDLSLESTLAFAPTIAVLCMTKWFPGLDPISAIFLTLIVGGLIGFFNGFCVTKIGINTFLQGLSLLIILRGLVLFLVPFALSKFPYSYSFLGNAKAFANIPVAVLVMLCIFAIFHIFFKNTRYGRYFFATGGNPKASYVSGINTDKIIITSFVLAGILAAVAGLLAVGRQTSVSNRIGDGMVLLAFAGAILGGTSITGGKGSAVGMLGGSIFLAAISNSLNLLQVNVFLVYATQGLLIFLALVVDRTKERITAFLFQQERLRKYKISMYPSPKQQNVLIT
jgi:simple sugar transport system permease protein/ribose transport system permease protein